MLTIVGSNCAVMLELLLKTGGGRAESKHAAEWKRENSQISFLFGPIWLIKAPVLFLLFATFQKG